MAGTSTSKNSGKTSASKRAAPSRTKTSSGKKASTAGKAASKRTSGTRSARSTANKASTASKPRSSAAKSTGDKSKAKPSAGKSTAKAAKRSTAKTTARSNSASKSRATAGGRAQKKGVLSSIADRVTSFLTGDAGDALELLKTDHDKVAAMFEKVKANEDGDHTQTFRRIKEELDLHAHVEEHIFYPHLMENGDKELKKIVREGLEEHGQVKMLLSEIAGLSGTSPTFKAKLKVLIEDVEHHVEEEENQMFPLVRDQVDQQMRVRLGSLIEAEKAKFGKKGKSASGH